MSMVRLFFNMYGDVCGYGRSCIRREAKRNANRSLGEIEALQGELFQRRVRDALIRFPVYAEKVRAHRGGSLPAAGAIIRPDDLPVWTRQDQRHLFTSQERPPFKDAYVHSTGGSTGEPTRFHVTRESYEWRMAVSDRGYSWASAAEGRPCVYVWGAPIKPLPLLKKLQVAIQHFAQRRVFVDSFIFDDAQKAACCRHINRFRPSALVGYAGNLVELALFVRAHPGLLTRKTQTAVTAAEGLRPGQRELLQETLAEEVFLSYGSREFMLIGMECSEHRGYHLSSDNLYVEVVDDHGRQVPPGQVGRILVTDLRNLATPFIRYEIGDMGVMAAKHCSCGLPFPLLASVEGRIQEYLYTASGDRVTALFIPHLMKEFFWLKGYQLVQFGKRDVRIDVIADGEVTPDMSELMVNSLKEKLGAGIDIRIEKVSLLKKGPSGKVPIVIQEALRGRKE